MVRRSGTLPASLPAHALAACPQCIRTASSAGSTVWPRAQACCAYAQIGVSACILGVCAQVKFNVNRVDNMVIQAIALLDTLDKDINTFVMRVREWYSWHFPELVKVRPLPCQPFLPCLLYGSTPDTAVPLPGNIELSHCTHSPSQAFT